MLLLLVQLDYRFNVVDAPPEPEPEVVGQTPAGRRRKRFYVEIDGNRFDVADASEALALLNRARALAERKAEEAAATAESNVRRIAKRTGAINPVQVASPEITVSHEIRAEATQAINDIRRLYQKAGELAELRILLAELMAREDEEEAEMLLLL